MRNSTLDEMIEARRQEIKIWISAIKKIQSQLGEIPQGHIRTSVGKNRVQYYYRDNSSKQWKYLRVKDQEIARKIIQSEYNMHVLKILNQELMILDKYQKQGGEEELRSIYRNLGVGRKKLVKPLTLSDEDYVKKWENEEYRRSDYREEGKIYVTAKGENVRSKSELIIADTYSSECIPYKYEKPLRIGDFICIPDFTVLNVRLRKEFYHEHFGMMDNPVYAEKAIEKINNYQKHGIILGVQLIVTFESNNVPLDTRMIEKTIDQFLR